MRGLVGALFILLSSFTAAAADNDDLKCDTGPILKTFGGTQWQVTSCNEDRHLLFVPVPGSPVGQIIFMLFFDKERWLVMDMGSGSRAAMDAKREIQSLSEPEIMALIAETKAH